MNPGYHIFSMMLVATLDDARRPRSCTNHKIDSNAPPCNAFSTPAFGYCEIVCPSTALVCERDFDTRTARILYPSSSNGFSFSYTNGKQFWRKSFGDVMGDSQVCCEEAGGKSFGCVNILCIGNCPSSTTISSLDDSKTTLNQDTSIHLSTYGQTANQNLLDNSIPGHASMSQPSRIETAATTGNPVTSSERSQFGLSTNGLIIIILVALLTILGVSMFINHRIKQRQRVTHTDKGESLVESSEDSVQYDNDGKSETDNLDQ